MSIARSERSIRRRVVKPLPIMRALPTDHEPLTPGLRPKPDRGEIPGFHAPFIRDYDYGDEDDE
jgi:hypothetical protein